MKFTTILFFCCLWSGLSAQSIQINLHPDFYAKPTIIKVTATNEILIGGYLRGEAYGYNKTYVALIDGSGNLLWEYKDFPNLGEVKHILLYQDEIIIFSEVNYSCDFYSENGTITKLDHAGNVLYQSTVENEITYPAFVELLPNGDLFIFDGYQFFEVRSKGNELVDKLYKIFNYGIVTDLTASDGNYLITGYFEEESCGLYFSEIYLAYDHIYSQCHHFDDTIFQIDPLIQDSLYIGRTPHELLKLNKYGWLLQSAPLNELDSVLQMEIKDQKIYLLTVRKNGMYYLQTYSTDLTLTAEIPVYFSNLQYPIDIEIANNKLYITGQEKSLHSIPDDQAYYYDNHRSSSIFIKAFDLTDASFTASNIDLAITDIQVNQLPRYSNAWCKPQYSCDEIVNIDYENVVVTVSNQGSLPISSFTITSRFINCEDCRSICRRSQVFQKQVSALQLLPGESKQIEMGAIDIKNVQKVDKHELCVWVSAPNQCFDDDNENDLFCSTFDVVPEEQLLTCWFNQRSERLNIEFLAPNLANKKIKMRIFDTAGKLVDEAEFLNMNNFYAFPMQNYSVSIYFLVLEFDGTLFTHKFFIY